MEKQGVYAPITRAAKRRVAVAIVKLQAPNKKCVVLGELTNLPNVVFMEKSELQREKGIIKKKVKKALPNLFGTTMKPKNVDVKLDNIQLRAPYVSNIYEYL